MMGDLPVRSSGVLFLWVVFVGYDDRFKPLDPALGVTREVGRHSASGLVLSAERGIHFTRGYCR